MRVVDLAKAIAPKAELKYVGIRPGEKLHESLISSDEALMTYDLGDRYMIAPYDLNGWNDDYQGYPRKEKVPETFAFNSENSHHLSVKDMRQKLSELGFAVI